MDCSTIQSFNHIRPAIIVWQDSDTLPLAAERNISDGVPSRVSVIPLPSTVICWQPLS